MSIFHCEAIREYKFSYSRREYGPQRRLLRIGADRVENQWRRRRERRCAFGRAALIGVSQLRADQRKQTPEAVANFSRRVPPDRPSVTLWTAKLFVVSRPDIRRTPDDRAHVFHHRSIDG
jgi:hypothetical protein